MFPGGRATWPVPPQVSAGRQAGHGQPAVGAPESLVERNPQSHLEVLAPPGGWTRRLDRRLEQFAEALPSRTALREIEAFEGERRPFAQGLAFDHAPVIGAATLWIRKNFESLRDESEHRPRLGAAGMKIGMELAGATLIGATELGRRETPIDSEDRVEICHDLSVPLSSVHII